MTKQGRAPIARGTGAPAQDRPEPAIDRPTVRMPHSQVRELLATLLVEPTDTDDSRPTTVRAKKATAQPPRKPAVKRSSPDELIALLRKSGLREPRR